MYCVAFFSKFLSIEAVSTTTSNETNENTTVEEMIEANNHTPPSSD